MIQKAEKIKNLLNDEINLFKKMVFNFNKKYLNYNYINNFNVINSYIKEKNLLNMNTNIDSNNNEINENLYNFCKEKDFCKKTSLLTKIFINLEELPKDFPFIEDNSNFQNPQNPEGTYLNNGYYINLFANTIYIKFYYKKQINTVAEYNLNTNFNNNFNNNVFFGPFGSSYYQYNISLFDNKIICFKNETILILNYYLDQKIILLNETIVLNGILNCFEIKKDHYLIVRKEELILWVNKKQKIKINNNNNKLFPVNDEFYIAYNSNNHVLSFNDVNTLQEIKRLNKIIDPIKVSILNNEFITFINDSKIYLIYLKNKELVQIVSFSLNSSCCFFSNMRYNFNSDMRINYNQIFTVDKSIYLSYNNQLIIFKYISEDKYFEQTEINISKPFSEKQFGHFLAYEDF